MSYEKKIKELMDRLAAMSPEPPPYPEETTVARPEKQTSRRPALVFATAAAVVAILAVPLLLFTGGEAPMGADSTTTTVTSTTLATPSTSLPVTTTTVVQGTTTTEPVEGSMWTGVVYFYQSPEDSFTGNPALVPVVVEVTAAPGTFSDHTQFDGVLALLAENGIELPEPFDNATPPEVRIVWWGEENGVVRPDMNDQFLTGAGGLLADMTMLNQLIYNLTWMNVDARVLFTVNDQPVETYGSEGLDLTDPVGRDSFVDHLHVINLTSPIIRQADGTYLVAGIANVFEATLNVAVVDGTGEIVHEESVMASCGSGCWGEFSASIDAGLIVPGESAVRVFTYSAEDGSPINTITVPIPEGDIWQFSVGE